MLFTYRHDLHSGRLILSPAEAARRTAARRTRERRAREAAERLLAVRRQAAARDPKRTTPGKD